MEAIRSSETSVHTRATWRHIPENGILQITFVSFFKTTQPDLAPHGFASLKIMVWHVVLYSLVYSYLQNIGTYLQNNMALHFKGPSQVICFYYASS
jgi:hypothetical protein